MLHNKLPHWGAIKVTWTWNYLINSKLRSDFFSPHKLLIFGFMADNRWIMEGIGMYLSALSFLQHPVAVWWLNGVSGNLAAPPVVWVWGDVNVWWRCLPSVDLCVKRKWLKWRNAWSQSVVSYDKLISCTWCCGIILWKCIDHYHQHHIIRNLSTISSAGVTPCKSNILFYTVRAEYHAMCILFLSNYDN